MIQNLKNLKHYWHIFVCILVFFLLLLMRTNSQAKNRIDLGDVDIKGELHNDGRLSILGRESVTLQNYVKFRTNYRQEMIQALPTPAPKRMKE